MQLKRRYELNSNLVEAVKGYMGHERETLDAVIKARNSAMAAEQKVAANPSDPAAMRERSSGRGWPPVLESSPSTGNCMRSGKDHRIRGRHAINVVTVLTRPSVGYAKFFGRIP